MRSLFLIWALLFVGSAVAAEVACDSPGKNCVIDDYEQDGPWTRTDFTVNSVDKGESFNSSVRNDHGRITQSWESGGSCSQVLSCRGERLVCERSEPCASGKRGANVWCGSYETPWLYGNDYFDATLLTCRGTDEWPVDIPDPSPPPHDNGGDGEPGGEERTGKDDDSNPGSGGGKTCSIDKTIKINKQYRDFLLEIYVRTVKRPPNHRLGQGAYPSDIVVHHQSPDRTEMFAQAYGPNDRPQHAVLIGQQMYMEIGTGQWLTLPSTGAIPGMAAINHDQYGPRDMVPHLRESGVKPGPDESCPRGGDCYTFHFQDDGYANVAYFSKGDCLLRAATGSNKDGPNHMYVQYVPQKVEAPKNAQSLMENPMLLMQLMGSSNDLFGESEDSPSDQPAGEPIIGGEIAHTQLFFDGGEFGLEISWIAQAGATIWLMLQDAGSAPVGPFNSAVNRSTGLIDQSTISTSTTVSASAVAADSATVSAPSKNSEFLGTPDEMAVQFFDNNYDFISERGLSGDVQILTATDGRKIVQVTDQLSGGNRPRLGVNPVLMADPEFLVLDESASKLSVRDLDRLENLVSNQVSGDIFIISGMPGFAINQQDLLRQIEQQMVAFGVSPHRVIGIQLPPPAGRQHDAIQIQKFGVQGLP